MAAADEARALAAQGRAHLEAGRLEAAEAAFQVVATLYPGHAPTLHALGMVALAKGELETAEVRLRQALAAADHGKAARISASLGEVLLARAEWAEGFRLFERWRETPEMAATAAPEMPIPRWRGEDVAGRRVLVWSEEGFGDQILYGRFAAELARRGAAVTWATPPELTRLVREGLGLEAVTKGQGSRLEADLWVPSSGLAAAVLADGGTVDGRPYLRAPPANVVAGLTTGVMVRGNTRHLAYRALDAGAAEALLALPGAVDLAPESTGARDFLDTAAVIAGLERVVTVDTAVAHLAGAMGKPVWVLLAAGAVDWRWGVSGERTAWYDSARLFRQRTPGDWRPVVSAVEAALSPG